MHLENSVIGQKYFSYFWNLKYHNCNKNRVVQLILHSVNQNETLLLRQDLWQSCYIGLYHILQVDVCNEVSMSVYPFNHYALALMIIFHILEWLRIKCHTHEVDTVIRVYQQENAGKKGKKKWDQRQEESRRRNGCSIFERARQQNRKEEVRSIVYHCGGVKIKRQDGWKDEARRGKEKGWRKHKMGEMTEMETWRPEKEESRREHNLRGRNSPRTSVVLNSLVLRHY